jgi:hypothetical protein
LTPNKEGSHKYSLRDIVSEIRQRFDIELTAQTILNWAEKYGWKALFEEGVKQGIIDVIANQDSDKSKEEQFIDAIAKAKHDDFLMITDLEKLAYEFLKAHGFTNATEALKAIEMGLKYKGELQEISEANIVVRIKRNGD